MRPWRFLLGSPLITSSQLDNWILFPFCRFCCFFPFLSASLPEPDSSVWSNDWIAGATLFSPPRLSPALLNTKFLPPSPLSGSVLPPRGWSDPTTLVFVRVPSSLGRFVSSVVPSRMEPIDCFRLIGVFGPARYSISCATKKVGRRGWNDIVGWDGIARLLPYLVLVFKDDCMWCITQSLTVQHIYIHRLYLNAWQGCTVLSFFW